MVFGILAHVDAGKTTLSEAMLYQTGQIRKLGRVDHQDAYLDHDAQERERGITIFSKQARIIKDDWNVTLLDTPGHVDFSAEMERTLQVLDYAILVVSGTDGVQGHTRTLWRLLKHYQVPTFLFINKMDLDGADRNAISAELKNELSDGCINFTPLLAQTHGDGQKEIHTMEEIYEEIAVCQESLLDEYMETGEIKKDHIKDAIARRQLFPCIYGSALKLEGVDLLLTLLREYTWEKRGGVEKAFAARVYKVGRDEKGVRLTYLKVTQGKLRVKELVKELNEKIDQIRLYSGEKYETVEEVCAGEVCAVTGLSATRPGQGLGAEQDTKIPLLEPVLTYRVFLPKEIQPMEMMANLRQLEEEDPQLHVIWEEQLKEIHIQMMGQVQIEVLTRLIKDRFGVVVVFGPGNIVYKETIVKPVEGVGHFEPLRHYAEAHILLEPGEPGSGIQISSVCSEDVLALNWQRLIATHIGEREHKGVLTGSALTDVKFTILTGRAHQKHTEGGDFRQATYRAIRQGLKATESILLEPYYQFVLEIPMEHVGRAMTDLQQKFAKFESPEFFDGKKAEMAKIKGRAPVSTMQEYMSEVHAYTKGLGYLTLELAGYDVCHNSEEVIEKKNYDSELDFRNPTGSVFCAHGAGYVVPWDEVADHMHMPYVYHGDTSREALEKASKNGGMYYSYEGQSFDASTIPVQNTSTKSWAKSVADMSEMELDAQLKDVYAREFGMTREDIEEQQRQKWAKKKKEPPKAHCKLDKKGNPIYPEKKKREEYLIVDGYNIIFAWQELKELSHSNIDAARDVLKEYLLDYQGWKKCHLLVVFDAYKVKGNPGKCEFYNGEKKGKKKASGAKADSSNALQGIEVVYTRQDETADAYIERRVHQIGEKYRVTVATSDGLEQLTVLSMGALRMPASQLKQEIERARKEALEELKR